MNKLFVVGISLSLFSFVSCVKVPEMTLAEIEAITQKSNDELVKNTVSKPWNSNEFVPGALGELGMM